MDPVKDDTTPNETPDFTNTLPESSARTNPQPNSSYCVGSSSSNTKNVQNFPSFKSWRQNLTKMPVLPPIYAPLWNDYLAVNPINPPPINPVLGYPEIPVHTQATTATANVEQRLPTIIEEPEVPEWIESKAAEDSGDEEVLAESDILIHFLSYAEEFKRAKALSLSESIQLLDSDIALLKNPTYVPEVLSSGTSSYRDKLLANHDDLETAYLAHRSRALDEKPKTDRPDIEILRENDNCYSVPLPTTQAENPAGAFSEGISKFVFHSGFEVCGGLGYCDMMNTGGAAITSISIDRDDEFIATAGDSKKIEIYKISMLLGENAANAVHYPVVQFYNEVRYSCVCWNSYIKNYLVSADYDGVVQLWDTTSGRRVSQFMEHHKRAWAVDFSKVDPTMFASSGEDCSVRIWSLNEDTSVGLIRNQATLSCVQFSPYSSHLLTCGSADNNIYCYDLRCTKSPWCIIEGHNAAVNSVKFLDSETIVSGATDSTVKTWDLNKTSSEGWSSFDSCTMTFRGHTNENNFVDLTVLDGYIACGSYTNEVYAYHRSLPMPIATHNLNSPESMDYEINCAVTSVCWRKKSEMLAAGNSSGNMHMLRMF